MSDEILGDRRKALEEQFFHDQDAALLEQLREKREGQQRREALSAASGIDDPAALDALIAADVSPDTLAAMRLVPLVATAWADGQVERKERDAIMKAAASFGITEGTPSYGLLESWLGRRPGPQLVEAWSQYMRALPEGVRASLREELMEQARKVAKAAGGFLGLGSKISDDEKRVLADLERAFG